MSTDGLDVPLDDIREMWKDLGVIFSEFSHAQTRSDATAEAVGHPGLADAIRHFSSGWDDRRDKLKDQIHTLEQQARDLHDGFSKVDGKLADAITPSSS